MGHARRFLTGSKSFEKTCEDGREEEFSKKEGKQENRSRRVLGTSYNKETSNFDSRRSAERKLSRKL